MSRKTLVITIIVLILIAALFVIRLPAPKTPTAAPTQTSPTASSAATASNVLSLDGFAKCMPRSSTNTTTVCDIGIFTKDGKNYLLVDGSGQPVNPDPYTTGSSIHVNGLLVQNPALQSAFTITGVVETQ